MKAQYPNGGWPQFYPDLSGYYKHITYNDDAMIGVMKLLRDVEDAKPDYAFVDEARRGRAASAVEKGVDTGTDRLVGQDPNAGPIWARFYEIGTNRPIFVGRDGVVKHSVAEIEHERRVGYNRYVDAPAKLLQKDYPAWKKLSCQSC